MKQITTYSGMDQTVFSVYICLVRDRCWSAQINYVDGQTHRLIVVNKGGDRMWVSRKNGFPYPS